MEPQLGRLNRSSSLQATIRPLHSLSLRRLEWAEQPPNPSTHALPLGLLDAYKPTFHPVSTATYVSSLRTSLFHHTIAIEQKQKKIKSRTEMPAPSTKPQRQVRALHDKETITLYQAYSAEIALPAVKEQILSASDKYSYTRMTWVKPSWAWMMYAFYSLFLRDVV